MKLLTLFALVATLPLAASVITVTSLNDSGTGSLRQAIATASNGDTIVFASGLSGGTILLNTELNINTSLTISGPGIAISGSTSNTIFDVIGSASDTFSNLTLLNAAGNAIEGTSSGTVSLLNSAILNNGTGLSSVTSTVINSTFSGNNDALGNGNISLFDSTISGNTTGATATILTIGNSIIAGNTMDEGGNIITDLGNNLIGSGPGFTNGVNGDIVGTSPGLGSLANNGGPTLTYALLAGSPAIDAGNNATVPSGTTTDQRGAGFARISGTSVDIGAFEVQQTTAPEPATYVTCLVGFAILALAARRKN